MENKVAKPLAIKNRNNKFQCDAFIDLNFAPDPDRAMTEPWEKKLFMIQDENDSFLAELVDYADFKFKKVSSLLTIAATGLEWPEWKEEWMKKYPNTTDDTMMAAYCYKRVK